MFRVAWIMLFCASVSPSRADEPSVGGLPLPVAPPPGVLEAQARRVAMIDRVAPSVVCVHDLGRRSGGSGVVIDAEGYGITNYHVVAGMLKGRKGWGGLGNGSLHELEVLGIDPTGDVAMFRLVGDEPFPFSTLGDSDSVQVGDEALPMGNPFSLSEDYSPTVTLGIVTGVHRYQWGVGNNLVYSDCIQTDASINPGNSGGPLYNIAGEVIGINGRISVNTRGRFNVGFGYAISANQIRRFLPGLRAGLLTRHGTLYATVVADAASVNSASGVEFERIGPGGPADRAGIRPGDRLIRVDASQIKSANQYVSVLGTYPAGRHVRLETERDGEPRTVVARLDPLEPDLPAPFEEDRDINLRETARVLRQYREAMGIVHGTADGTAESTVAGALQSCTVTRVWLAEETGEAADSPRPTETYRLTFDAAHIQQTQVFDDGATGKVIEFDDKTATQRTASGGSEFALPAERAMVFQALFILHRNLPQALEGDALSQVRHAGGDVLIRLDQDVPPVELEVIEWRISEDAVARFGFDLGTHHLRRVIVRDKPSAREVTIYPTDYRQVNGLLRACTIETFDLSEHYIDSFDQWTSEP